MQPLRIEEFEDTELPDDEVDILIRWFDAAVAEIDLVYLMKRVDNHATTQN